MNIIGLHLLLNYGCSQVAKSQGCMVVDAPIKTCLDQSEDENEAKRATHRLKCFVNRGVKHINNMIR